MTEILSDATREFIGAIRRDLNNAEKARKNQR
jgi:hypothetical protein